MPYAVARLDRDAVTHDADAVWRRDVVTYLQPRGPRGRRRRRARKDGLVLTHNSNSSRCPQQINGGFVYALARSPVARRALSAWFGACANMVILSKVRFDSCHSVPVLAAAAGWFRAGFSCLPRSSKH